MTDVLSVERMTVEEKLRAMEALWDSLRLHEADVPVQQWHKDVLDKREQDIAEGKAQFEDWGTVKKRLSEKLLS